MLALIKSTSGSVSGKGMKRKPNVLSDIHTRLTNLPIRFRERICEECNWSIPTFYRKMRLRDKVSNEEEGKIIPALSNAEKEKIIAVLMELFAETGQHFQRYSHKH
ncbi:MAG: hypothetical protein JO154_17980 [Chitinophaga sp.]|uniref:hypothetical protein n=1 Tax=Chitinophaga sp. TaxID=1869181 RepID=UPI0025B7CBE4|nr:hypothetical protein [Chitinophaga sp.]MBV8254495.1 hypothetical protein [Chitinophaga sp.]